MRRVGGPQPDIGSKIAETPADVLNEFVAGDDHPGGTVLLLGRRGRGSKPAPVRFASYRGESLIHCHYANPRSDRILYGIDVGQRLRDLLRDGSKRPLVGAALGLLHGVFAGTRAIDLLPIVHPDSAVELSWLLVLVRASDMSRTARVVLTSGDRRIELPPLRFSRMG
jgi:hypothetical protein